jgi:hypothetical protein
VETKPEIHIHKSNCTVVAVDDALGVVYMTCVTGSAGHKITSGSKHVKVVNMHSALGADGKVQPVAEVKGRCIHWVMFDEEDMRLLVDKGQCLICDLLYVVVIVYILLSVINAELMLN